MEKFRKNGPLVNALSRRSLLFSGFAALLFGFSSPALADRRGRRRRGRRRRAFRRFRRRGGHFRDKARDALERGEIRPLREVMAKVRRHTNVEVLDVDLHRHPPGWIYALRVITPRGQVRDVFLDAATLEVLHLGESYEDDGVPLPDGLKSPKKPHVMDKPIPPLPNRSGTPP